MKASANLLFWIGCIVIIISAIIQLFLHDFLTPLIIIVAVFFCIRQWYRRMREVNEVLVKERNARVTADQYIYARMSPGGQRSKKKR